MHNQGVHAIFASNLVMFSAAITFAAAGIIMSICFHDFLWFARFGSLITGVGIVLFNRPAIVRQDLLTKGQMTTGLSSLDPEHYRRVKEPIPSAVEEDRKSRNAVWLVFSLLSLAFSIRASAIF
jgi:hypothetical protein